jgi:hypothetical protein
VEVATSAALKTLLQVATPSTTDIRVKGWGLSFDGVVVTNPAGVVTLIDVDVAATVSTLTPEEWESDDGQASLCVGGTAATGYNASAEGTIGASRILDGQEVHPQTGYSIWFPNKGPRVKASRFLRIRALFSVDINGIPWIIWEEPA